MDGFAIAIVGLLLLVFGIVLGVRIGEELATRCTTTKDYWLYNLAVLLVGSVVSAFVWATGWVVLAFLTIGLIAGGIAGLKFGFGESVGPWKIHDRFLRVNKSQVKAAKTGRAAAARERRKKGEPEPELMSVATPGTDADTHEALSSDTHISNKG